MFERLINDPERPNLSADAADITWENFQALRLQPQGIPPAARTYADLPALYEMYGEPTTTLGKLSLINNICNPPNELELVQKRESAINELCNNSEMREELKQRLQNLNKFSADAVKGTDIILRFLSGSQKFPREVEKSLKSVINRTLKFFLDSNYITRNFSDVVKGILNIGAELTPQSQYLNELFNTIASANESFLATQLKNRKFVVRLGSLDPLTEKKPWIYSFWTKTGLDPLQAVLNSPFIVGIPALMVAVATGHDFKHEVSASSQLKTLPLAFALAFLPMIYETTKRACVVTGVSKKFKADEKLVAAINALGVLDELITLSEFQLKHDQNTSKATVKQTENCNIKFTQARSPILSAQKGVQAVVPSDIIITTRHGMLFTGKNSSGKTTWSINGLHNGISVLLGLKAFADPSEMEVPDRIFYISPSSFAHKKHGRFGSELIEILDTLKQATSRSLVIFDEIGGGTRENEAAPICFRIIKAFQEIGASIIVVTHNAALAERFRRDPEFTCLQPQLDEDGNPTFKFRDGIAESSGAEDIALDLGADEAGLLSILNEKGVFPDENILKW